MDDNRYNGAVGIARLLKFLGVLMLARCGHDHLEQSVSVMLDAFLQPTTPKEH